MGNSLAECPYCGTKASVSYEENFTYQFVECPTCGRFEHVVFPCEITNKTKNEVASFLFYNRNDEKRQDSDIKKFFFIGNEDYYHKECEKYPWCYFLSLEEIEAFFPKTFSEKIDRILLGIANKSFYIGEMVEYTKEEFLSACFIKRYDSNGNKIDERNIRIQFLIILDYLSNNHYIEYGSNDTAYKITLEPNGWQRVDELQKQESNKSNHVFVAMSFAEDMKEVREAIKKSITESGYIPRIMDEIEHNHQIVPEMLYEIRKSKFVVAELTGHNNGAYFEAGYALGQGKEVIQACNKDKFGTDGHFDVKQVNTILWENTEDLTKKLSDRIKATISR